VHTFSPQEQSVQFQGTPCEGGARDAALVLVAQDVTEMRRLEGMRREFVANVSHELKTPLTILKGEFEVISKKVRSQEEYEMVLKSGLEEIDKIAKLVDNLLMLASFESRKILPERKKLDLNLLIQGVVNSMRGLADKKGIRLTLHSRDSLVVNGDEHALKQLFLNLLDNAVKYTPAKGLVTVDLEREGKNATIRVRDTGVGIPDTELGRIFDRFYRAEHSKAGPGFGLGLSIVKSVVDSHKGSIRVDSRVGTETVFVIKLPLA